MKRLVWLVLAVFCAALGQVQAVNANAKAKRCPCCHPGACTMPGCCPPPSSSSEAVNLTESAPLAREVAARQARLARTLETNLYLSLVALALPANARPVPASLRAPAAKVPLFRAHCSFLI